MGRPVPARRADRATARAMMQGFSGRRFSSALDGMFLCQRQQAVQTRMPMGRVAGSSLRPNCRCARQSAAPGPADKPGRVRRSAVRGMHMVPIRGKLARLDAHMDGDDFPTLIEDAHQPGTPTAPRLGGPHTPAAPNNRPAATRCSRPDARCAALPRTPGTNPPGSGESFGRSTSLNTLPTCCRVVP